MALKTPKSLTVRYPRKSRVSTLHGRGSVVKFDHGRIGVVHDTPPPLVDMYRNGILYYFENDMNKANGVQP